MDALRTYPLETAFRHAYSSVAQRWATWRYRRRRTSISLNGINLVISPGVFHPIPYSSSRLLLAVIESLDLHGKRVLDMGTGSGIMGIAACKKGASVVAVDSNPEAVECARKNFEANCPASTSVGLSDVFSSVPEADRFDWIIWNPPFYPRQPVDHESQAWLAGKDYGLIRRFAREAPLHLTPGGIILMIFSTDMDIPLILLAFAQAGLHAHLNSVQKSTFEDFVIIEFSALP